MKQISINKVMDEFYAIVNTAPVDDAVSHVVRCAGKHGNVASIEALARLLVIENTRRRHAEARFLADPH